MPQFTLVQLNTMFYIRQIALNFILIYTNPHFPEILAYMNKNHKLYSAIDL